MAQPLVKKDDDRDDEGVFENLFFLFFLNSIQVIDPNFFYQFL